MELLRSARNWLFSVGRHGSRHVQVQTRTNQNPRLERSRRKLAEATFFLERASATAGRHPQFGVFLSAFLSAVRSVGFVIQADLRGIYGVRFDNWWEDAKGRLPTTTVPFAVMVELRNQALKAGELLPGMRVVVALDHPAVEQVTLTVGLSGGQIVTESQEFKFRKGSATLQLSDPDDLAQLADELVRVVKPILDSLNSDAPAFSITQLGYQLHETLPAVSFDEMMAGFREHVRALKDVIAEAETLFIESSTRNDQAEQS